MPDAENSKALEYLKILSPLPCNTETTDFWRWESSKDERQAHQDIQGTRAGRGTAPSRGKCDKNLFLSGRKGHLADQRVFETLSHENNH